jgi:hypothetical protein
MQVRAQDNALSTMLQIDARVRSTCEYFAVALQFFRKRRNPHE